QQPNVAKEVELACARLGQAANLDDPTWAKRSADALSAALCEKGLPREDCRALAISLVGVIAHLPRIQAAEYAARVTDALLTRLQNLSELLLGYSYFGPAIEVMSPYLDAAAADRTAKTIGDTFGGSESSPLAGEFLAKAQIAVCKRLPPTDFAA